MLTHYFRFLILSMMVLFGLSGTGFAQEKTNTTQNQPAAVSEDAYYGDDSKNQAPERQRSPRRGRRVYRRTPQPQQPSQAQKVLKQAVGGAAIGAIAGSASGGDAGKGAAVGAGTGIIGGALMDALGGGAAQQQAPVYEEEEYYDEGYYEEDEAAQAPPSPRRKRSRRRPVSRPAPQQNEAAGTLLKRGLGGAAIGAIAGSASGGDAGKGAAVGAGTGIIGGVLMDALGGGQQQAPVEEEYYEEDQYYDDQGYDDQGRDIPVRRRRAQ